MANPEHLAILNKGMKAWNKWRNKNPKIQPDLKYLSNINVDLAGANLSGADLVGMHMLKANLNSINLSGADLRGANLSGTDLSNSNLSNANLSGAKLSNAILSSADLSNAILSSADLTGVSLIGATLFNTNFNSAYLFNTNMSNADLNGAKFNNARIGQSIFSNNDLSVVEELDLILHSGPSAIGIDTLYRSGGNIPESFLRGCGVPDEFITFLPSIIGAQQAIQFYSCFISYSTKDERFAKRLHSRMRDNNLRVWFAPEDIKGGQKLHEQLERAIQMHDRLLIVLSEESMKSQWVQTEIRKAREIETAEIRRKLFPIMLVDYEAVKKWKCFDADTGKDLAVELREYYIPDFSNWKEHDSFEREFEKLLRDLKAEEK